MKLVKIRYIIGPRIGFEHVMKEEIARVLVKRGQVEIVKLSPGRKTKAEKENENKEAEQSEKKSDDEESDKE
jgi:hypothetical protein